MNKKKFDIDMMKEELKRISGKEDIVFLEAVHKPKNLYDTRSKKFQGLEYVNGKRAILFSSIGDPEYFEETVKDLGANVLRHIVFPDHHNYSQNDIKNILRMCGERNFDILVTTEKDAVKLGRMGFSVGSYSLMTLAVEMDITAGRESLIVRLHSLYIS